MATRADHYAIILTINRYPGLSDLAGPENDGLDFKDWLLDPRYGALPADNVRHIRSSEFGAMADVYDANPTDRQLVRALDRWLRLPLEQAASGWCDRRGERLYLYFAGHGFTSGQSLSDSALFSAVAQSGDTAHIAAYRYLSRIANAGFFDEIVLVMDCCQDVLKASTVIEPSWNPPDRARSGQVKLLQAYGAPRGRRSFEREIGPAGESRGLLSSVLMEALRNAPADEDGWVTGAAVKALFLKLWNQRYKSETGYDPPLRLPDGEDIRLYRRPAQPQPDAPAGTPVAVDLSRVLARAEQIEREAGLDGDAAPTPLQVGSKSLRSADLRRSPVIELEPGLHVLRTAGGEPDLAFEVPYPQAATTTGPAQAAPVEVGALGGHQHDQPARVRAPFGADIAVFDADYALLGQGREELSLHLPPGVYKAQATLGEATLSQLFAVADAPVELDVSMPAFAAAAPVTGTATTHEYQSHPAQQAAQTPIELAPGQGELFVFLRDSAHRPGGESGERPASMPWPILWSPWLLGIQPLDTADAPTLAQHGDDPEAGYTWRKYAAKPGTHALVLVDVMQADPTIGERGLAIPVVAGWRTEVYLDCAEPEGEGLERRGGADPAGASVHLVRCGQPALLFDPAGMGAEAARAQWAAGRAVAPPPPDAAAVAPLWALLAACSAWDGGAGEPAKVAAILAGVPDEVRAGVSDFVLLDRWGARAGAADADADARAASDTPPLRALPLLAASWRLSAQLGDAGLASVAAEAFGQWRSGATPWTAWRQRYGFSFHGALDLRYGGRAEEDEDTTLQPPWSLPQWTAVAAGLRHPDPAHSPFQQALRRRLLDALEDGTLPERGVFELAAEFGLSRAYAARAYRQLFVDAADALPGAAAPHAARRDGDQDQNEDPRRGDEDSSLGAASD